MKRAKSRANLRCGLNLRRPDLIEVYGVQLAALALQPGLCLFHMGAKFLAERPEVRAMVHFLQMRHFMGGKVVDHRRRRHDDTPGEAQISLRRTGAPAAASI